MKIKIFLLLSTVGVGILTSCSSPPPMYQWYEYSGTSYNYVKTGDDDSNAALLEVYQKIIDGQEGAVRLVPPPGICADYGFMLISAGKIEEGKELLLKEKELYPESVKFIDSIMGRLE